LGTIPRCYLLAILGWQMGSRALSFSKGVDRFESLISLTMVGGVVLAILYLRRRVRKKIVKDG